MDRFLRSYEALFEEMIAHRRGPGPQPRATPWTTRTPAAPGTVQVP